MESKRRRTPGLFLAAMLFVLCLGAQPAFATGARVKLGQDGGNICTHVPLGQTAAGITGSQAQLVCSQMQKDLINAVNTERDVGSGPALWQLSQVIGATLDVGMANVPASDSWTYAQDVYNAFALYSHGGSCPSWNPLPAGYISTSPDAGFCNGLDYNIGKGTRFYDDNAWVGSDLMQAYHWSCKLVCNQALLTAAQNLFNLEQTGVWKSTDANGTTYYGEEPHKPAASDGGLFFSTDRKNRGVVANADSAEFATDLYAVDQKTTELTFAKTEYNWVRNNLEQTTANKSLAQDPTGSLTGLFFDHLKPDGCYSVVPKPPATDSSNDGSAPPSTCASPQLGNSYGSGLMIGVGVNLAYDIPANSTTYKSEADFRANAANGYYTDSLLELHCPAFNAIYFHYLWLLDQLDSSGYQWAHLPNYTAYLWSTNNMDQTTGQTKIVTSETGCEQLLPQAGTARVFVDDVTRK